MKKLQNFPILSTSDFNASDGTFKPVSEIYTADLHERINYRGLRSPYHISINRCLRVAQPTQAQRKDAYEVSCLERGNRPFNYPENLWNEYLNDCASEEHTNRNESRNAWRYQI